MTWTSQGDRRDLKAKRAVKTCMTSCKACKTYTKVGPQLQTHSGAHGATHPGQRPQGNVWRFGVRRRPGKIKTKKKARPSTARVHLALLLIVFDKGRQTDERNRQRPAVKLARTACKTRTLWYNGDTKTHGFDLNVLNLYLSQTELFDEAVRMN